MKELIGTLAVVLGFISYAPYFIDLFKHKTEPHPYSWFIWGLTSSLIFVLQILHGGEAGAWTTATVAFFSFVIAIVALAQGGKRNITWHDQIMLAASIAAIGLWLVADQPTLTMLLLVSADLFGFIPSLRKSWNKPYSETLSAWSIGIARHGLSIFALSSYTILTLANSVVWVIGNTLFCILILARRRVVARR